MASSSWATPLGGGWARAGKGTRITIGFFGPKEEPLLNGFDEGDAAGIGPRLIFVLDKSGVLSPVVLLLDLC